MKPKIILAVCNGNIHRSVIAEHCLKRSLIRHNLDKQFIVISRGIQGTCGTQSPPGKNIRDYPMERFHTEPILNEIGIVIPEKQQNILIDLQSIESASIILSMDAKTLTERPNSLVVQFASHSNKMRLFRELEGKREDVPDCFGSDDDNLYRETITLIDRISNEHFNILIDWIKTSIQ